MVDLSRQNKWLFFTKNKHDNGVNIMVQATWNETILAESDQTIMVEGNHYFPPDSINQQYFKPSDSHTMCGWKGFATITM